MEYNIIYLCNNFSFLELKLFYLNGILSIHSEKRIQEFSNNTSQIHVT